mmetsp:Transcript_28348/g.45606  ORF Transcript_28348/g.45606 Transcript_28348/m.45606 type:complete len:475 (+) Transcript_28348:319-1743(+)
MIKSTVTTVTSQKLETAEKTDKSALPLAISKMGLGDNLIDDEGRELLPLPSSQKSDSNSFFRGPGFNKIAPPISIVEEDDSIVKDELDILDVELRRILEHRALLQEQQRRLRNEIHKATDKINALNERKSTLYAKLDGLAEQKSSKLPNGKIESYKQTREEGKLGHQSEELRRSRASSHELDIRQQYKVGSFGSDILPTGFASNSPRNIRELMKDSPAAFFGEDIPSKWGNAKDPLGYSNSWGGLDTMGELANFRGTKTKPNNPMMRRAASAPTDFSELRIQTGSSKSRTELGIISFKDTNDYGYILTIKDLDGPWVGYYSWKSLEDPSVSLRHGDIVSFVRVPNPRQSPPPFIATQVRLHKGGNAYGMIPPQVLRLQELIKEGVPGKQLVFRFRREAKREQGILSFKGAIKDKGYIYVADREDARIGFRAHKSLLHPQVEVKNGDLVSFIRQKSPRGYPPFIAVGVRPTDGKI